jgi:hypothetical protein
VDDGETKKTIAGKIGLDRDGKTKSDKSSAAIFSVEKAEAAQQFSQRKIFVVHTTTAILKCNPQVLSHTFESEVA